MHYFDIASAKLQTAQKSKRSKRDVQRAKAETDLVLSDICDAVVILDSEWKVLSERRFAAMLDRRTTNIKGRHLADFIYWEDHSDFIAHVENISSNESLETCEDHRASASMSVRLSDAY